MLSSTSLPRVLLDLIQTPDYTGLVSDATIAELSNVSQRPKLNKYVSSKLRDLILEAYLANCSLVDVISTISDCVDPDDNAFLALALDGSASTIISGDQHLLRLHPWRGIDIVTASAFLDRLR